MQQNLPSQTQRLQQVHHQINSNQFEQAWEGCLNLIREFPKFGDAWMTKSFIADRVGHYDDALVSINKAIRLEPRQLGFKLHKVMLLERMGQLKKSLKLGQELLKINIKDKRLLTTLASYFNKHQQFRAVEMCYRKALELEPNSQEIQLYLANAVLFLGDVDAAKELADKALRGNVFDCDVYFFKSSLTKQSHSNNNIVELKAFIA